MAAQGNYIGYHLTRGGGSVYAGITDRPDERRDEHRRNRTRGHDTFQVIRRGMSRTQALEWERQQKQRGIPISS